MTTSTATQPYEAALAAKPLNDVKQQILLLYLGGSDLGSQVIGWTLYDGTDRYNYDNNESDDPMQPIPTKFCGKIPRLEMDACTASGRGPLV